MREAVETARKARQFLEAKAMFLHAIALLLLEIFPLLDQIRHATRHLKSWMKPQCVGAMWFVLPSRAYIVHQPLGVNRQLLPRDEDERRR